MVPNLSIFDLKKVPCLKSAFNRTHTVQCTRYMLFSFSWFRPTTYKRIQKIKLQHRNSNLYSWSYTWRGCTNSEALDPARGLFRLKSIKSPSSWVAVSPNSFWMSSKMMLQQYLCPAGSICWQLVHLRNGGANLCLINSLPTSMYVPVPLYDHLCWVRRMCPQELKRNLSWFWKLQ